MTNKVDFDNFTENYNELLKDGTNFFSTNEEYFAQYKVSIVQKKIDFPVIRLLEFGCGIGRNISFLRKSFPDAVIIGTDISTDSLEIARKDNAGIDFICEEETLDFSETFDLIFLAGVFHHIPIEQRDMISATLLKRLSPTGMIFVFEHNPYNPITQRIVNNCPYDEDAILLRPGELRKVLEKANFQIVQSGYCLFIPPKFSKLVGIEKFLSWFPLGGQYWIQAKPKI